MTKPVNKSSPSCPFCGEEKVVQHLPREIDRQLFHEEITVPAEPEPKQLTVAILRVTYEREYVCPACGGQWVQSFTTEIQKHV